MHSAPEKLRIIYKNFLFFLTVSFQGQKDLPVVDESIPVAGVVVSVAAANFEAVATIKEILKIPLPL